MRRSVVVLLCVVGLAAPAAAQSTYVGASLVGDIARFSKIEGGDSRFVQDNSIDGESLAVGVTVGRALGDKWGVEMEFVRSGEIERRTRSVYYPAAIESLLVGVRGSIPGLPTVPGVTTPGRPGPGGVILPTVPIPVDFPFEEEVEQRQNSLGALAWVKHDVGDHVELSYVGGVTFFRTEIERESNGPRILIYPPVDVETTSIDYDVAPTVGLDGQFKFGDHTAIVTGVRLHALTVEGRRGFLIRPSVGLRWRF
jgi:hypothetical protein